MRRAIIAACVAALLAWDRSHSTRKRFMYMFGAGLPVVNTAYLRDMLKVFPDAQFFSRGTIAPIMVKSSYGEGIIMPIRIDEKYRERREVVHNLSTFADRYGA